MNDIRVPHNVAQAVVDYLKTKPYQEVAQLIAALLRCEELEPERKPDASPQAQGR